jgi:hypothetical protein
VKAIRRPKKTTSTQQAIDIPPARLAAAGGVGSRFHFCTSRTVVGKAALDPIHAFGDTSLCWRFAIKISRRDRKKLALA